MTHNYRHTRGFTCFHQSTDLYVSFYVASKFLFLSKESMKMRRQLPMPCPAKLRPSATAFFYTRLLHTLWNSQAETCSQSLVNFLGEGKGLNLSPCLKPLSTVSFSWESPVCQYSTETSIFLWSLDPRRMPPAASTGLLLSWNITVLHLQIKVSIISLLCGVKLDLLTSWMQQPGIAIVMTASVLGSIQLGIGFFSLSLLWWKGEPGKLLKFVLV